MKTSCTDQTVGKLLHGYELHLLNPEEETTFELHLMECEFCCEQINAAAADIDILRNDSDLKAELAYLLPDSPVKEKTSIWHWLGSGWRPVAAVLLMAILMIPLYTAYHSNDSGTISPLEVVNLLAYRNGTAHTYTAKQNSDIALSFLCDDFSPGKVYTVRLYFQDEEIYVNTTYADFNASGVSYLHLPHNFIREGTYRMVISENIPDATHPCREYMFSIQITD